MRSRREAVRPERRLCAEENRSGYSLFSRRRFLELGAAVAATAVASVYSPSSVRLPSVYGQTSGRIIQVGIEQYPVDLENPIVPGEVDKDTIDNLYSPLIGRKTVGHLYVKRDSEFTKFIADFPTSVSNPKGFSFDLFFDTKNSNSFALAAEGVYTLKIKSTSSSPPIEIPDISGIPFSRDFHSPEDYYWRYFFAPSPLNSTPHVQVKAEFKTDIILRSDNASREIIFFSGESEANGVVEIPWGTKLRFVDKTVAEPFGAAAIAASLGLAAYIAHRIRKSRITR
jgi:hypothetical protein